MRSIVQLGLIAGLIGFQGCFIISGNFNPFSSAPQPLEEKVIRGEGKGKILLVDVSNMISNADEHGPLGLGQRPGMSTRIREQLDKAAKDDDVKALLLRINSPGGTVTASDMIFHDIMEFKAKRRVPVYAQILDMGTSGAYYIALSADEIVAAPTGVTGSVGVILSGVNLAGLMEKIGVKNQTLKTGEHKDSGSPLRPMTADDEKLLQAILLDLQSRFVATVRDRRPGLKAETVKTVTDGRILTANQAVEAGLIDRIGYLDDTLAALSTRVGESDPKVVMYRRSDDYSETIYASAAAASPQLNLVNFDFHGISGMGPQFLYMWTPTP